MEPSLPEETSRGVSKIKPPRWGNWKKNKTNNILNDLQWLHWKTLWVSVGISIFKIKDLIRLVRPIFVFKISFFADFIMNLSPYSKLDFAHCSTRLRRLGQRLPVNRVGCHFEVSVVCPITNWKHYIIRRKTYLSKILTRQCQIWWSNNNIEAFWLNSTYF